MIELDGKLRQYSQWCFDNCKSTKVSTRMYPPSSVEVAVSLKIAIALNDLYIGRDFILQKYILYNLNFLNMDCWPRQQVTKRCHPQNLKKKNFDCFSLPILWIC